MAKIKETLGDEIAKDKGRGEKQSLKEIWREILTRRVKKNGNESGSGEKRGERERES